MRSLYTFLLWVNLYAAPCNIPAAIDENRLISPTGQFTDVMSTVRPLGRLMGETLAYKTSLIELTESLSGEKSELSPGNAVFVTELAYSVSSLTIITKDW